MPSFTGWRKVTTTDPMQHTMGEHQLMCSLPIYASCGLSPQRNCGKHFGEETRKVDKTGCVKLNGLLFDVGPEFVGKQVDLRLDPFDMDEVEVWLNGGKVKAARQLDLAKEQPREAAQRKGTEPSSDSRYLKALHEKEKRAAASKTQCSSTN